MSQMKEYRAPVPLRHLYVEITSKCPLSCIHCSTGAGPGHTEAMSIADIISLFEQARALGMEDVCLSGGDPFSHDSLALACEWLSYNGIRFSVYTCGTVIVNNELRPISKSELRSVQGVSRIILGLYGRPKAHDMITGVSGSFSRAYQTARAAVDMGTELEIHFVPMQYNWDELHYVCRLSRHLGAARVSVLRLVSQGRARSRTLELSLSDAYRLMESIAQLTSESVIPIRLGAPWTCLTLRGEQACTAAQDKLLISSRGRVLPCEAFKFTEFGRPSLQDHTLRSLWENDQLLNSLRALSRQDFAVCGECRHFDACRGGCAGQRLLHADSLVAGRDPLCDYEGAATDHELH